MEPVDKCPFPVDNAYEIVENQVQIVDISTHFVDNLSKSVDKWPFSVDNPVDIGTFWVAVISSGRSKERKGEQPETRVGNADKDSPARQELKTKQ